MKILAVYAHPSPKSFNHALLDVILDTASAKGHTCSKRDLYAEKFNPVLTDDDAETANRGGVPDDVKSMQDSVRAADVVAFIHPIWWFGVPAILKGWIDRVFTYGFAYGHDSRGVKPLLAGKKAIIINTAGGAEEESYNATGFKDAILKLNDQGIYEFVGFEIILRRFFFEVPAASDADRREMLDALRSDMNIIL